MKNLTALVFSVFVTLAFSSQAFAGVVVIVHPSNNATLDQKAISKIFMGKSKKFPGGGIAVPINIKEGSDITEAFNASVLKKSGAQLKSYWSKLVFTGKGSPPKEVASEAEVIELIKSNPSMIGFVSDGAATPDVKVVASF